MDTPPRKPYPFDVTDDEWAFVSPYLVLMTEAAVACLMLQRVVPMLPQSA